GPGTPRMSSDLIYMDNAATTYPKPDVVHQFMTSFFRDHGFSPGRSGYDAGLETEQLVWETRVMLTSFFGGDDPKRLTFSLNASDALNTIIFGTTKPGDHVVTTTLEHNSVLRPLHHRQHAGDVEVTHVPNDQEGYVDPDDVAKAIKKNTKLV